MLGNDMNLQLIGIPKIREIEKYLRNVDFGRRLLGYDPDEVHDCIAEVARRYKTIIASLLPQHGQDLRIQDLQEGNAALWEQARWYERTNSDLAAENEWMRQEIAALRFERAQSSL